SFLTPTATALERVVAARRELIQTRFPDKPDSGAAAVLLGDGSILTGTSPDFPNPSTTVCHETEPYLAAFWLNQPILASLCLHRTENDRFLVLARVASAKNASSCMGQTPSWAF